MSPMRLSRRLASLWMRAAALFDVGVALHHAVFHHLGKAADGGEGSFELVGDVGCEIPAHQLGPGLACHIHNENHTARDSLAAEYGAEIEPVESAGLAAGELAALPLLQGGGDAVQGTGAPG